jgi:hypothetical protein
MSPRRKTLAISGLRWAPGEAPGLVLLQGPLTLRLPLPPLANSPGPVFRKGSLPRWPEARYMTHRNNEVVEAPHDR